MFVCAYKRTVQGRVQISPVARYRSKRPLAPRGRASGRKYWAGGPSAVQILQAQQNSLTPDPLPIAFAGSFLLAGISLFVSQTPADDQIDRDQRKVDPQLRECDARGKDRNAPTVSRAWRKASVVFLVL